MLEEIAKELMLLEFPHLRSALNVSVVNADFYYNVRRGRAGLLVEISTSVFASPRRAKILARAGRSAQEIYTGLTSASCVCGKDEIHS